jgi:hypothetical protein
MDVYDDIYVICIVCKFDQVVLNYGSRKHVSFPNYQSEYRN